MRVRCGEQVEGSGNHEAEDTGDDERVRVFEGQPTCFDRVLLPVERLIYRLTGIEPGAEMDWKEYALAFIVFAFLRPLRLSP
jgi:hypothetical protein